MPQGYGVKQRVYPTNVTRQANSHGVTQPQARDDRRGHTYNIIADAFGFYTTDATGTAFTAMAPTRILDTSSGLGVAQGKIGANSSITLRVGGVGAVPLNATAVVLRELTRVRG
ncbi:MAG TPA: hypothetical protein VFU74_11160 [Actinocrinis sp.]|nr:hypothetical protein [Actinocrinis sp.]